MEIDEKPHRAYCNFQGRQRPVLGPGLPWEGAVLGKGGDEM